MKRYLVPLAWVACIGLILAGVQIDYGPSVAELPGFSWLSQMAGKVDRVVVVYESLNQPVAESSLLAGATARAIRKAGKWRQYDKDELPEALESVLLPIAAKYGVPCIALLRGGKVVASGKLPKSDLELAALIERKGGY